MSLCIKREKENDKVKPKPKLMNDITKAGQLLQQHICEIHTVQQWADEMGYESVKYFSRLIRDHYGSRPKELIIKAKVKAIRTCLSETQDEILFCLARDLGFVNDAAMYKFVKRHTGLSPTELKRECEKGV